MSGGARFHTFPLLCAVYFVCFSDGRSTLRPQPSLALPPIPCGDAPCPGQAASLPLCWLLSEVGARLAAARAAWGRENNKGKQRIPLQKAGEEGRWPVSVGPRRQRAGDNGSSVEHKHLPLSLSTHRPDESHAGAELSISGVRTGEEWLEVKNRAHSTLG